MEWTDGKYDGTESRGQQLSKVAKARDEGGEHQLIYDSRLACRSHFRESRVQILFFMLVAVGFLR